MSTTETKSTIYLFTTTQVGLYKRDLLNVCCFPHGWQIEFGYKKEYLPEKLRSNPDETLVGHPAAIVFCEPLSQGDIYYEYHPVRSGTIKAVRKDLADSLTLSIRLDKVFDYSVSDATSRVEAFQEFVNKSDDRPRTLKSERMTKENLFVRSGAAHFSEDSWQSWDKYWHSLVGYLGQRKGLDDSLFLRSSVRTPDSTERGGELLPAPKLTGSGRLEWKVKSGVSYDAQFEVRSGSKADHVPPTITVRDDLLTVLGPFVRQSGDGTEVDFLVVPKRIFETDHSTFVIRVAPAANGKERSSELAGILEVRPPRWLLPCTLALLIVGSALMSLDSKLLESWFGAAGSQHPYWNGTAALALAKLLGSAGIGVGGFLGFRKLPMKG